MAIASRRLAVPSRPVPLIVTPDKRCPGPRAFPGPSLRVTDHSLVRHGRASTRPSTSPSRRPLCLPAPPSGYRMHISHAARHVRPSSQPSGARAGTPLRLPEPHVPRAKRVSSARLSLACARARLGWNDEAGKAVTPDKPRINAARSGAHPSAYGALHSSSWPGSGPAIHPAARRITRHPAPDTCSLPV
jgi:hypothetical protein